MILITTSCGGGSSPSLASADAGAETSDVEAATVPGYHLVPRTSGSLARRAVSDAAPDANVPANDANGPPLLTVDWFGAAVFHDAQGNELGRANAPAKFPLPDGGSVTFGIGYETFTFLDVPAGATLRPFIERAYPLIRQSIHINVVDRSGSSIVASTGCASATGPGEHVLSLDDDCLESGKGELFIYALQNGAGAYIEVKDIVAGIAELDPLDVPLPDWTDFPVGDERVRLDTTGLPDAVTGVVGLYAVRGHLAVMGTMAAVVASDAGSGTALADALLPTTGTHWIRSASFYPFASLDGELAARSYRTEPLAYPLASPATYDFGTLLPIPAHLAVTQGAGATITFDLPAPAGDVDRIVATFAWGDPKDPILWHVVTKPTTTRISLPNIPSYLATPEASMLWVEVRAEDHPDVEGWVNVLKDWHDTFLFQSPEQWPTGRMSRSVWQAPAVPADADAAD